MPAPKPPFHISSLSNPFNLSSLFPTSFSNTSNPMALSEQSTDSDESLDPSNVQLPASGDHANNLVPQAPTINKPEIASSLEDLQQNDTSAPVPTSNSSHDDSEPLSAEEASQADDIINSLERFKAENRKATQWGFYKHLEGNTYASKICAPALVNLNAKYKKDKKGFVQYSSERGVVPRFC